MIRFFRKRRPVVRVRQLSRERVADLMVASAWGMDEAVWDSLSDFERATCRRTVTTAPNFQS